MNITLICTAFIYLVISLLTKDSNWTEAFLIIIILLAIAAIAIGGVVIASSVQDQNEIKKWELSLREFPIKIIY